jgi:hypothetical protein
MNITVENFTKQLHDGVEKVEDLAKLLKEDIRSATQKNQAEIQSKLEAAKLKIEAKKQEFAEYRVKLQSQFEEKEAELKSTVEEWKANQEVKKLEHRADRAEDYAATAIFLAMAMMEEAEAATLEAICTRLDAEAAVENPKEVTHV